MPPIQRSENHSVSGQLSALQASAGNQAVLQMMRNSNFHSSDRMMEGTEEASAPSLNRSGMPPAIQAKMESALGADFSNVRIHEGSQKAREVGALAYTQGSHIHFAPGQYNPDSSRGQQLLGHELTHVVQQKQGRVSPTAQLAPGIALNDNPSLEREADQMGARAARAIAAEQPIQRAVDKSISPPVSSADGASSSVIQRMPSPAEVKQKLGEPKKHVKNPFYGKLTKKMGMKDTLKQNSTHYRTFLQKVEDFDNYVDTNRVGDTKDAISAELDQIMTLYAEVEQVSDAYIRHNGDNDKDGKVVYIRNLKTAIPLEKTAVRSAAAAYKLDPDLDRPFWKLLTSTSILHLTDEMSTGESSSGGVNTVSFFEIGPDIEGVFKETKDVLLRDDELPESATEKERDAAYVEYIYGTKDAQISADDAHMANRNIAMYKLDQLLGGGVIARAEFALYNSGAGVVKGSYMEKAKGKSGGKVLDPLLEDIKAEREESFNMNDPVFQRALSRMQLLDTLAMQIDRHVGNFFIHRGDDGKVIAVTGIDNDMAFGLQTDLEKKHKEYPGLSKFVDKELAERILALRDDVLRTAMEDLLSPAEIDALLNRLNKLKQHLRQESTRLLSVDDWRSMNESMRQGDKSYATILDATVEIARSKVENKRQASN